MQIQYIYIYIYILLSLNFNFNYCINNFLYKSINHVLNNKFKYISITALAFIFLNYKKTIFKYFDKNSYYKKEPKNSSLFSNKEDLNLKKQNPNYTSKEELYGKQQEK